MEPTPHSGLAMFPSRFDLLTLCQPVCGCLLNICLDHPSHMCWIVSELEEQPEHWSGNKLSYPLLLFLLCFVFLPALFCWAPILRISLTSIKHWQFPQWISAGSELFGDESKSDCVKDIFSEVTEIWPLVLEPSFALDTNIASAVGEFRFQPLEKIH